MAKVLFQIDASKVRPLREGDVIKLMDGTFHYIQYVNTSGAYAVPLAALVREIKGHSVNFNAGGRSISANSIVEVIDPREMGVSSQEYGRYVKMALASGKVEGMAKRGKPVTFAEFDNGEAPDLEVADEGQSSGNETETPTSKDGSGMAKKAKAVKREKTPKTVRKCACGCSAETTGYFAPGHDARFHGWLKKLADGRMEPKELPAGVRAKLDLVATKEGFRAKAPHFYKD